MVHRHHYLSSSSSLHHYLSPPYYYHYFRWIHFNSAGPPNNHRPARRQSSEEEEDDEITQFPPYYHHRCVHNATVTTSTTGTNTGNNENQDRLSRSTTSTNTGNNENRRPSYSADLISNLLVECIPGVGPALANKFMEHFGGPDRTLDELITKIEDREECVNKLKQVSGVGPKRVQALLREKEEDDKEDDWFDKLHDNAPWLFLVGMGLRPRAIKQIRQAAKMVYYNDDGDDYRQSFSDDDTRVKMKKSDWLVEQVQTKPYQLLEVAKLDVDECSSFVTLPFFKLVDQVAYRLYKYNPHNPARLDFVLKYKVVKDRLDKQGFIYTRLPVLLGMTLKTMAHAHWELARVVGELGDPALNYKLIARACHSLLEDGTILCVDRTVVPDESMVYSTRIYYEERYVAKELAERAILNTKYDDFQLELDEEDMAGLTDEQRSALNLLANETIGLLVGGPGVGKTHLIRTLYKSYEKSGKKLCLAAFTGKASVVMAQACSDGVDKAEAYTIHKLIALLTKHYPEYEFDAPDAILIDEAFMVDLPLFYNLLKNVNRNTRIYLVGDERQLPPVGPGDVCEALLKSGIVPVARLTKLFRQVEGSGIANVAHAVRKQTTPLPLLPASIGTGFQWKENEAYFVELKDPEHAEDALPALVRELESMFKVEAVDDIQVLAPANKGSIGRTSINKLLKNNLNPSRVSDMKSDIETDIEKGDRVIQLRNCYVKEVFNGEVGIVVTDWQRRDSHCAVNFGDRTGDRTDNCSPPPDTEELDSAHAVTDSHRRDEHIVVNFGDRTINYSPTDTKDLDLAYAITVHKSQGDQFEIVILAMHDSYPHLLKHNRLIYTGITRAKRCLVLVGTDTAIKQAVFNLDNTPRSLLKERLWTEKRRIKN